MDRASGIGESNLAVDVILLTGIDGTLEVADIVQRIEDTDDVDTVFRG